MRIKWSETRRLDRAQISQLAAQNQAVGQTIASDGTITLFRRKEATTHEFLSFTPSIVREGWFIQLGETWKDVPCLPNDIQKI